MNTLKNKPPSFKHWAEMALAFLLAFVVMGQANAAVTYSSSTGLNVPVNGTTIWMKLNTISGSVGNFTIGKIGGTAFAASSNFRITKNGVTITDVPYYAGQLTASFNLDLGSTAGTAYWKAQRYTPYDAVPLDPNVVSGYVYVTTTVVSDPIVTPSTDIHGNTVSTAAAISFNANVGASINYGGDIDYFRITPSSAGTLTVYTTGDTDTYGTLFGGGGAVIAANDDATTSQRNFRIQYPVPASGTYFIAVRHYYSTNTGVYTLRADFSPVSSQFPVVDWNSSAYRSANLFWSNRYAPKVFYSDGWSNLGSALGNCTWYAHGRLRQLGYTVSLNAMTGNAATWAASARNAGIIVNTTPAAGAIAQSTANRSIYKAYGHVAVVERVNSNGTVLISESSYAPGTSWDFKYRTRTVSSTEFNNYIHVKKP